jgi:uncharacterized protein (DUF362 family)
MSKVIITYSSEIIKRTIAALEILSPSLPEKHTRIFIKPNLVEPLSKDSGAITRPEVVEGIIKFLGDKDYEIYIVEGAAVFDTMECFRKADYLYPERNYKVKIVDLHKGSFIKVKGKFWKDFAIAALLKGAYIVSVPVLRQHPYQVTLSQKNMMGALKPIHSYPTKQYMHRENNRQIWAERLIDLISHIRPNLSVIDATTGMFSSHLFGRLKTFNATVVSEDPVSCDLVGADLLSYKNVFYLEMAIKRGCGKPPFVKEKTIE